MKIIFWKYLYFYYRDHLGNNVAVRDMMSDSVVQRTVYYASGLPMAQSSGAGKQPYKYNGKEFVEMHGLDEHDSHARWYYPAIMRTTTMDPLAENDYHISPYAWCGDNPIANIDITGKKYKVVTRKNTKTIKATIYTNSRSYKSAKKAADFWNKKTGYKYTSSNGKQYDIKFEITVKNTSKKGTPLRNEANIDNSGNSYEITLLKNAPLKEGTIVNGTTDKRTKSHIEVRPEREDADTGAHEVGHILGLAHSETGIMTEASNDPNRTDEVSQNEIDQIIQYDQDCHPIRTIIESLREGIESILKGDNKDERKPDKIK
jgi:RHS repeat-associated protein